MKATLLLIILPFITATGYSNKIDSLRTIEYVQRFISALGGRITAPITPFLKTDIVE